MEDVAQQWLAELGHRCMIQISERSSTGNIKSFHVHDLMRDLCLSKAREEKFLEFILPHKSLESDGSSIAAKSRRTAINLGSNERYVSLENLDPNVRSLLVFRGGNDLACLEKAQVKSIYKNFHLLRVLDLGCVSISGGTMPKEIGNLINLRYLSLRHTGVKDFPSSLGNLRNLQTLDIMTWFDNLTVPDVIWKLDRLRHLILPYNVRNHDLRLDTLSGLQTLEHVPGKFWMGKGATQLTNLKNLEIRPIVSSAEADAFFESPVIRLGRLESLYLELEHAEISPNLKQLSSCLSLSKLSLIGKISKQAQYNFFPPNLTKLTLCRSRLEQDPMAAMGNLFNLRILKMIDHVYIGKEMVCTMKAFPKLECLILIELTEVEEWRLEEGAMPCLRRLVIHGCRKFKVMPDGLKFITTLQELDIGFMPKAFVNKIRVVEGKGGEDLYKVQHIPFIKIEREVEDEEEEEEEEE